MQQLIELGVFCAKALVLTGAVLAIAITIASLVARARQRRENIEIEDLNEKLSTFSSALKVTLLPEKGQKAELKAQKKKAKDEDLARAQRHSIFVLDFLGDIKATPVDALRDEVNAILAAAQVGRDEVVVRLESGGGLVHSYGLAAAQLLRLKSQGLKLTVCVDKIAASGGYMMACTANQILAAPFAVLGSIGVVAQVPNFHKLLKKHDIDYEEVTAGEFKRTVSLLGEITEKGRKKFLEQIEDTHGLFKDFVHLHRPKLNLDEVATGEYWFGERALGLGLVDQLMSSDEYLYQFRESANVVRVKVSQRKPISERLSEAFSAGAERVLMAWWEKVSSGRQL